MLEQNATVLLKHWSRTVPFYSTFGQNGVVLLKQWSRTAFHRADFASAEKTHLLDRFCNHMKKKHIMLDTFCKCKKTRMLDRLCKRIKNTYVG